MQVKRPGTSPEITYIIDDLIEIIDGTAFYLYISRINIVQVFPQPYLKTLEFLLLPLSPFIYGDTPAVSIIL
jgi:hypothetical protein